jgi:hypothetical protein
MRSNVRSRSVSSPHRHAAARLAEERGESTTARQPRPQSDSDGHGHGTPRRSRGRSRRCATSQGRECAALARSRRVRSHARAVDGGGIETTGALWQSDDTLRPASPRQTPAKPPRPRGLHDHQLADKAARQRDAPQATPPAAIGQMRVPLTRPPTRQRTGQQEPELAAGRTATGPHGDQ